jgi:hypothetical protein
VSGAVRIHVDKKPWAKIKERLGLKRSGQLHVKVGVLADKGGDEMHEGEDGEEITLIELAAIHEFGVEGRIPERSFIRRTFDEQKSRLEKLIGSLAARVIKGSLTEAQALELLGQWAAAEIKKTITTHDIPPPLAQETIDRKGSSKPLVDTGQLVGSISYSVSDGDPEEG